MKKLIRKIKTVYHFYKWYKQYLKNDKKVTVGFIGYGREYREFVYLNNHLNVIWINSNKDIVGRTFDVVIQYGPASNHIDNKVTNDLLKLANYHTRFKNIPNETSNIHINK